MLFLKGKILLLIYFIWSTNRRDQIIMQATFFTMITTLLYLFISYLGFIEVKHILILSPFDFVYLAIYLWILDQHEGIHYWIFTILGFLIYAKSTFYFADKYVVI